MRRTRLAVLPVIVVLAAGCSENAAPRPAPTSTESAVPRVSDPDHPDGGEKKPGRLGPGTVKLPVSADRIAELGVRYTCLGPAGGLVVRNGTALNADVGDCHDDATYGASIKAKDLNGRKFGSEITVTVDKRTRWRMSVDITDKDGVRQTVHS
ncbi:MULTISPECIES: hypothetical protein [Streptomyces]|uniref:Lipoprotein n=1 Tax=Streptomyces shaanxiensis TaxID=653357 RepID=A0ABP7VTE6_9ACTN|nr:hypothetical protein [Streptomyces sp. AC550_RSS872]